MCLFNFTSQKPQKVREIMKTLPILQKKYPTKTMKLGILLSPEHNQQNPSQNLLIRLSYHLKYIHSFNRYCNDILYVLKRTLLKNVHAAYSQVFTLYLDGKLYVNVLPPSKIVCIPHSNQNNDFIEAINISILFKIANIRCEMV